MNEKYTTFMHIGGVKISLIETFDSKEAYAAYSAGCRWADWLLNRNPVISASVTVERSKIVNEKISSYP